MGAVPAGLPDGCGAPVGGRALVGVDVGREAVVEGILTWEGRPVDGGYVRLLDHGGEFVAEVQTSQQGRFRFFAAPGSWTLRALAPAAAPVDRRVEARLGDVVEVVVEVGSRREV